MQLSDRKIASKPEIRVSWFRVMLWVALFAGAMVAPLQAGSIDGSISADGVTASGEPLYRFTYTLTGFDFRNTPAVVDGLDIEFDPALFGSLENGLAGPGFDLLLFQPGNPPGASGDYSALALTDHAPLTGTFSVDATWIGAGTPLDTGVTQTYFINEFNNNPSDPNFGDLLNSTPGTVDFAAAAVPEPKTVLLSVAGFMMIWLLLERRRRNSRRRSQATLNQSVFPGQRG
jgi:hypothetical protein